MNVYSKCPICDSDVIQGDDLVERVCDVCGENFLSNSYCKNGHFICNKCASKGYFQSIDEYTTRTNNKDPIAIVNYLMHLPGANLVGCKHAIMVYASVLTAYKNCGGHMNDFEEIKLDIQKKTVVCPTAMCRLGAFCGIPISMGISMRSALSSMDKETCIRISNNLTSYCINNIANPNNTGNKNCCVRNTYLTIIYASKFISRNLWIDIPLPKTVKCDYHVGNPRCVREECIFYHGMNTDKTGSVFK